jgi:hypothetical protein
MLHFVPGHLSSLCVAVEDALTRNASAFSPFSPAPVTLTVALENANPIKLVLPFFKSSRNCLPQVKILVSNLQVKSI